MVHGAPPCGGSRVIYRLIPENFYGQPPKTPNSALRSLGKMLIYHNVNSAFASVASLDFGVFGGCLWRASRRFVEIIVASAVGKY